MKRSVPLPSDTDGISPGTGRAAPRFPGADLYLAVIDRVNAATLYLLCLMLAAMSALGFAQVIARYLVGTPLTWSEEVLRFALIWLPFIGAGIAVRKGLLIAVEVVANALPAALARPVRYVVLSLSALFWLILVVQGVGILDMVQGMRAGATEVPMWIVYLVIPIGSALALLNTVAALIDPPETHIAGD